MTCAFFHAIVPEGHTVGGVVRIHGARMRHEFMPPLLLGRSLATGVGIDERHVFYVIAVLKQIADVTAVLGRLLGRR